jgi:excisionase family DNA binding protein
MSPAEVAARAGLSLKTVYRAIRSGALVAHQPTAKYLISEAAYRAWVTRPPAFRSAALASPPPPPAPGAGSAAELLAIEAEVT